MKRKTLKRRNLPFLFHLFALCADWTLVALTAGFKKCFLVKWGTRKEEKEEKRRNPKKRRILMNTQACLWFQNSPTADSWVHFNFSLITHPFFKPEELITYLCEVPYAMRPFRTSSCRHSPRNQQQQLFHFFLFRTFSFILVLRWSLFLPFLLNTQAQGWKMKRISNVQHHFFSLSGGVDMQLQFICTVNTCI